MSLGIVNNEFERNSPNPGKFQGIALEHSNCSQPTWQASVIRANKKRKPESLRLALNRIAVRRHR